MKNCVKTVSLIDLLTNGANSPHLLITNRLQLVISPQLAPDKVSQSLFEKSSLDDMTQSVLQQLCTVIKDKSKQLFVQCLTFSLTTDLSYYFCT
jgi:hypothetical protein